MCKPETGGPSSALPSPDHLLVGKARTGVVHRQDGRFVLGPDLELEIGSRRGVGENVSNQGIDNRRNLGCVGLHHHR